MSKIKTHIIPYKAKFVYTDDVKTLDLKAICVFSAIGFFLDGDTYYTNQKVLRPASNHTIKDNLLLESKPYFKWHYSPRDVSFNEALEEFILLFEKIISEQIQERKVILPLSGGLDSRTQAAALRYLGADVSAYSYDFKNGYPEAKIACQIANICGFKFKAFKIEKGYLWDKLDELVELNGCYSDFTSPRQMAIIEEFSSMGDVISLGHWGDVLFDSFNCKKMSHDEQVQFLSEKLIKRGGLELANNLWQVWDLEGDFESYFKERLSKALNTINIEDTNARLRAFKSKYWAPRWTSVNLSIFENKKPIVLPYYDNRMCEFICTIPDAYLKERQIQIAYTKKRNPELAKLVWQDKRPYNLYNFKSPQTLKTLNYKITNKLRRSVLQSIGKSYIQRNWELQFIGDKNKSNLESVIHNSELKKWIPETLITNFLSGFYNKDTLQNAHSVNMILVLAKFYQKFKND